VKLQIEFAMDNAAFDDNDAWDEAARIVRRVAGQLEYPSNPREGPCVDANGNTVGRWSVTEAAMV
jgi:hypothetical protein